MLEFFEELLGSLVPLLFIFLGLYVLKFILSNIIAWFVPAYEITIYPDKITARNVKTGQAFEADSSFYTALVPDKKAVMQEIVITYGKLPKPQDELEKEFKQRYSQFQNNNFYNSQERLGGFWSTIINCFVFMELHAHILTAMCGRHSIQFQAISTEQQAESKKAIKGVLRNARFIASNGHGIST